MGKAWFAQYSPEHVSLLDSIYFRWEGVYQSFHEHVEEFKQFLIEVSMYVCLLR
jgi:hypothetical protein